MKYGIEMESVARTSYNLRILDEDEEIQQIGLVVNKNYPFLASSVDGIVLKNGKINRIIEIKCPKLLAGQDPHNFENVLTNSQKNNFGEFHLKKNHPYLYQVVTSMLIFEVEHCDFIVWSDKNMFKIYLSEIDISLIENIKCKLKHMYYSWYVPEMFLMRAPRNLICREIDFKEH
ncbi:hypothetical protein JTB14_001043 [Gonioctena quinquepunctata]|nr:hypothetical protein JTB14_001043 [Gonioctena quinquepunctata]